ncbi:DUF167 domain-containing protein [Candidatus Woesearchaeota archaeon]|nr:DUF167 domain-containing protein [Candidatus Woesearchaeota archaeon]
MRIEIKVKPNSGKSEIKEENGIYTAHLRSPPEDGKANLELLKLARKYFKKPAKIILGKTSKNKVLEI